MSGVWTSFILVYVCSAASRHITDTPSHRTSRTYTTYQRTIHIPFCFIRKFHSFTDVPPQRNKFYQPSADGCGSLGLKIDTEYLPAVEMENCCNAHDICYDTCNKDKELCDLDFKRCLYNYCESHEKTATVGSLVTKSCKAAAKLLSTGTLTLGCKSYLDSQERACYCSGQQQQQQKSGSEQSTGNGYKKKQKFTSDYSRN